MADPNLLLVVVDCLRADRIYDRAGGAVLPNIMKLMETGHSFTKAFSSSGTTTPSFASILTGTSPARHGATMQPKHRLNSELKLMQELFRARGYATYASVTGPLDPRIGLDRGFDRYDFRPDSETLNSFWGGDILEAIRSLPAPWFALVHYWDLHEEINVLPRFDRARYGRTSYDRALSGIDAHLGALIGGLPPDSIICLLGDHGEDLYSNPVEEIWKRALMNLHVPREDDSSRGAVSRFLLRWQKRLYDRREHRAGWRTPYSHGFHLYDHLIHVPWIFSGPAWPRAKGTRCDTPVLNDDVMPTILPLFGIVSPPGLSGIDRFGSTGEEPIRMMYGHDYWYDGSGYLYTAARSKTDKVIRVRPGPGCGQDEWIEHYHVSDEEEPVDPDGGTLSLTKALPDPNQFSGTALSPKDEAVLKDLLENLGYL